MRSFPRAKSIRCWIAEESLNSGEAGARFCCPSFKSTSSSTRSWEGGDRTVRVAASITFLCELGIRDTHIHSMSLEFSFHLGSNYALIWFSGAAFGESRAANRRPFVHPGFEAIQPGNFFTPAMFQHLWAHTGYLPFLEMHLPTLLNPSFLSSYVQLRRIKRVQGSREPARLSGTRQWHRACT